jgi:hypothetical protein
MRRVAMVLSLMLMSGSVEAQQPKDTARTPSLRIVRLALFERLSEPAYTLSKKVRHKDGSCDFSELRIGLPVAPFPVFVESDSSECRALVKKADVERPRDSVSKWKVQFDSMKAGLKP